MALQDIELQMKKDYEMHDRKFALLKSQVLELREQLSDEDNQLRAKDQYIQQTEERCLEAQNQLFKAHKKMDWEGVEREGTAGDQRHTREPPATGNHQCSLRVQGTFV